MSIREQIISEGVGYKGIDFSSNYFFSSLAQGFLKDRKTLGEDTVEFYTDVFGEEYGPIFESFDLDADVLSEAIQNTKTGLLFEDPRPYKLSSGGGSGDNFGLGGDRVSGMLSSMRRKGAQGLSGERAGDAMRLQQKSGALADTAAEASANAPHKAGILASLWDGLKKFGANLATKFPGVASFLKNGVAWIAAHPAAVIATAGGTVLIAGLIRALKKRGENKKAAALQAKLDAAKGKSTEK